MKEVEAEEEEVVVVVRNALKHKHKTQQLPKSQPMTSCTYQQELAAKRVIKSEFAEDRKYTRRSPYDGPTNRSTNQQTKRPT